MSLFDEVKFDDNKEGEPQGAFLKAADFNENGEMYVIKKKVEIVPAFDPRYGKTINGKPGQTLKYTLASVNTPDKELIFNSVSKPFMRGMIASGAVPGDTVVIARLGEGYSTKYKIEKVENMPQVEEPEIPEIDF